MMSSSSSNLPSSYQHLHPHNSERINSPSKLQQQQMMLGGGTRHRIILNNGSVEQQPQEEEKIGEKNRIRVSF